MLKTLIVYSFFVTNVVKHVVVADFEQKNSGRFRGGAITKKPEKARKIKEMGLLHLGITQKERRFRIINTVSSLCFFALLFF